MNFDDSDDSRSSAHDEMVEGKGTSSRHAEESETSTSCGRSKMTQEEERKIAKKETSVVIRLRLIVFLTLVASATVVAESVYLHLFVTEQDTFQTAFKDDSEKLLEAIGTSLDKSFGLLDSLAVLFISFSRVTNQTWPFVTMPDFAVRMAKIVPLTDSISVNILPVVTSSQRSEWEAYTLGHDQWVNEGMQLQEHWDWYYGPVVYNGTQLGAVHSDFETVPYNSSNDMLPNWQNFPVIPNTSSTYNTDYMTHSFADAYKKCLQYHSTVVTAPYMIPSHDNALEQAETILWAEYYRNFIAQGENPIEPMSDMIIPIVDDISQVKVAGADDYDPSNNKVVGAIAATFYWRSMIQSILPKESDGIRIVFDNGCTDPFTYQINGPEVQYLGASDDHDAQFDDMVLVRRLHELGNFSMRKSMYTGPRLDEEYCTFTLRVYPSNTMKSKYVTSNPAIFTTVTVLIFVFTSLVFYFYDYMVEKRQRAVMQTALHTSAIVSSLFPSAVRDRLFPVAETKKPKRFMGGTTSEMERESLDPSADSTDIRGSPIAEMYPDTTVLFADIAGFTAWSSERTPTQVFHLLETLYAAFDKIAKQRGVFKVETIGDCYVAVVGLPVPRKLHAVVMTRFAIDCRNSMQELTSKLEETLGPGTRDLALRIGLNSGPTTAGVLRGEKSRFQLFGDTVNTAARMESSGQPNRIHISDKTAALIRLAGKGHWLHLREETVNCKGKGLMTTYWCEPKAGSYFSSEASTNATATPNETKPVAYFSSEASATSPPNEPQAGSYFSSEASTAATLNETMSDDNLGRLIAWNCDIFMEMMGRVVDHRSRNVDSMKGSNDPRDEAPLHPWDDVVEVLAFPRTPSGRHQNNSTSTVSIEGSKQMGEFITAVAHLYQQHPFHNFEHCSHVVMATKAMLDTITECPLSPGMTCSNLLSHPITRIGILFAALVHDVDHPGVSNTQLAKEQHALARKYNEKGVAEQNSIDIAWKLFMGKQFTVLRDSLFASESDLQHFRKVVVNVVLATDLFDKNLRDLRDSRWVKSFDAFGLHSDALDLRATIILDLIIQASDVSHTMQHFSVYRKWNKRLLIEMYDAYKQGRATKNPMEDWYEGELWFFDNYVIPLTKRLRECDIFGNACEKFSNYAEGNRMEWELHGRAIVREITEDMRRRYE